jgi:hypothetical protein
MSAALVQVLSCRADELRAGDVLLRGRGCSRRRVIERIELRPDRYVRVVTRGLNARGARGDEFIAAGALCYVERYPLMDPGHDYAADVA